MRLAARIALGVAGVILLLVLGAALFIAIEGWNWARAPIERMAYERTGRQLSIAGDLRVSIGWRDAHVRVGHLRFANPPWAREPLMIDADDVQVELEWWPLLRRRLVIPQVRLVKPTINLEQAADGRKSWLLDPEQKNEGARVWIGRLLLDEGRLGYDEPGRDTHIKAELSTRQQGTAVDAVLFRAAGRFRGEALALSGQGGPVLSLRDETLPYPIDVQGTAGATAVRAQGTITSLLKITALDLQLALKGQSLGDLYNLLSVAFPNTPPYRTQGHLLHHAGRWRYENFSGVVGATDLAGELQVDAAGDRLAMKGSLRSRVLDIADLGPVVGTRATAPAARATDGKLLPEQPFRTDRLRSMDAEVDLAAGTIRRAQTLPLEQFATHVSLHQGLLTLAPFQVGVAGGQLKGTVKLDARTDPIQAAARLDMRDLQLSRLLPAAQKPQYTLGRVHGELDLHGRGNSVGAMLAAADGQLGLAVDQGRLSRLLLEKIGLHLWEMLQVSLSGDQLVQLRCGIADFDVKGGVMRSNALVLDTDITTVFGDGTVDLGHERLDLTLRQRTKNTSPLALTSPIHVRGPWRKPDVGVDKGGVAMRALGSAALAAINPLLLILPLIDPGPGRNVDCPGLLAKVRQQRTR